MHLLFHRGDVVNAERIYPVNGDTSLDMGRGFLCCVGVFHSDENVTFGTRCGIHRRLVNGEEYECS